MTTPESNEADREPTDDLGFNAERMLAGEASAKEGRTRPQADAIRELRARVG